ncbi:MAG: plethodontid receptivity factor PRF [Muribaculaceae bacterium]|nr:plethodontid receptivity factor PRF [Muribaculaceae bacterium]
MKRISIILAALTLAAAAHAEVKVLERSDKKTPDWITGAAEGYIVSAVEAPSIAEARTRAEQDIAAQMAMTVARNIDASYSNTATETVGNNGVDSRDTYTSSVAVQAARLPFIKGISLSKADAVYWVKVRDKDSKAEYYQYYVRYPFFRVEQAALEKEFEQYDAAKEAELVALEADIDNVDSLDGIKSAIGALEGLRGYFFDKVRAARTDALIARYRALPKSVVMSGAFTGSRTLVVSFSLNDHAFKVYGPLKVTSNCASAISVKPSQGAYTITFNTDDCLDDEENFIDVNTRFEGRKLAERYSVNSAAEAASRFSVVPTGKVMLAADTAAVDERAIAGINIRISLNNRGGSAFGVKALELEVPTLANPIVIDNIDAVYTTRGVVQLALRYEGSLRVADTAASKIAMVNGTLTLINPLTEAVERVKIALPYSANWLKAK